MSERAFARCLNCSWRYTYSFSDECKTGEQAEADMGVETKAKRHKEETRHTIEIGKTTSEKIRVV